MTTVHAYQRSVLTTRRSGDALTVPVSGGTVAIYGPARGQDGGARVLLDGKPAGAIDHRSPTGDPRLLWVSTPLAPGEHILTVVATGRGRLVIDHIVDGSLVGIPIVDAGVELGSLDGWQASGAAVFAEHAGQYVAVHTGSYKATIADLMTGAPGSLLQTITGLRPGARYRLTGWLQSGGRDAVLTATGGGVSSAAAWRANNAPTSNGYYLTQLDFTVPAAQTSVEVGFSSPQSSSGKYAALDDLRLDRIG
ncbi:MAG: hypothetical protein ACR2KJ_03450 [Jatrophihabitans sp.]